jgi:hypothetical protein
MKLEVEPYLAQAKQHWPASGRVILANFDERSIVVYQAYRPEIGHFAAANQYFGGDFSLGRMSWIKPNFMWMMYRSSWGQSDGQEVVLAVRLQRGAFDQILRSAVHSTFSSSAFPGKAAWQDAVAKSDVRLQWDPDHGPSGQKLERRALQLGLRRSALASYAREWIVEIEDVSEFVAEQRRHVVARELDRLLTPRERVYPVSDAATAVLLQLDHGRS